MPHLDRKQRGGKRAATSAAVHSPLAPDTFYTKVLYFAVAYFRLPPKEEVIFWIVPRKWQKPNTIVLISERKGVISDAEASSYMKVT